MERNFKYKVGDRVIATDNINFNKKKPGTIVELWYHSDHPSPYRVKFDDWDGTCLWSEVHSLIVPKQKIVITTDGVKITTAKLYENGKVVKTAEAKCCPEDTFDFNVGANLAINRLIGKPICAGEEKKEEVEWKVVKRPAKVGDYIRLIEAPYSFDTIGDILKVDYVDGCAAVYQKNHPKKSEMVIPPSSNFRWNYHSHMYEVVEKVTKETEPKKEDTPVEVDGFKVGDRVHVDGHNGTIICIAYGFEPNIGVEFDDGYGFHNCEGFELRDGNYGTKGSSSWRSAGELTHGEAPKYYNGKVVCVDNKFNKRAYTIGKIYQFVDGVLTTNTGCEVRKENPCKSFKDWDNWTGSKFIEVVE